MSFIDKLNLFFVDFSLMPVLCYENYITTFANGQEKLEDLERLAQCADLFSLGDLMHNQIFTNGNWNLLPDLGRTAVVAPCNIMKGFLPYARFPEVMGKFSTQRKSARLIRELKESAGHHFYASKMSVQNESIPMLYDYIITKLDNPKDKDKACHEAA